MEDPLSTRSQRKRAAIICAASAEFRTRGFRDTSMDRIAERAGVSKRTVYNHFNSKDELFRAITSDLMSRLAGPEHGAYDPARSLEDQLREVAGHEVEVFTSDEFVEMARAFFSESVRSPELVREAFAEAVGEDAITRWVRQASAAGALRVEDPDRAARQLSSLLKGPLFWPLVLSLADVPTGAERRTTIDDAIATFLARFRAPRSRSAR